LTKRFIKIKGELVLLGGITARSDYRRGYLAEYLYKVIDRFLGLRRRLRSLYNSLLFIRILLYLPYLRFTRFNKVRLVSSLLVLKVSELVYRV
jgi:hypothetical protein